MLNNKFIQDIIKNGLVPIIEIDNKKDLREFLTINNKPFRKEMLRILIQQGSCCFYIVNNKFGYAEKRFFNLYIKNTAYFNYKDLRQHQNYMLRREICKLLDLDF